MQSLASLMSSTHNDIAPLDDLDGDGEEDGKLQLFLKGVLKSRLFRLLNLLFYYSVR